MKRVIALFSSAGKTDLNRLKILLSLENETVNDNRMKGADSGDISIDQSVILPVVAIMQTGVYSKISTA